MSLTITHNENQISIGDTVNVHQKVEDVGKKKGEIRTRIQIFEGTVIAINGKNDNKSFTVRRISSGNVGIERIFPILSPVIEKVEVLAKGDVRRSKLYYLRNQTARGVSEITKRYLRKAQAAKQAGNKQDKATKMQGTDKVKAKSLRKKSTKKTPKKA